MLAAALLLSAGLIFVGAPAAQAAAPPDINVSRPAVTSNVDGRIEVFAVGSDGLAYHVWDEDAAADRVRWSGWESLGDTRLTGGLAAIRLTDDNLAVFGRRAGDGAVVYNRRFCWFGTVWCGWKVLSSGVAVGSPAVVSDRAGRARVVVRGLNDNVMFASQTGGGYDDWSLWNAAPGVRATADPTVIKQQTGDPVIFVRGSGGQISVSTSDGPEFLLPRPLPTLGQWDRGGSFGVAMMRLRAGERVPVVITSANTDALVTRSFQPLGPNLGWTSWAGTHGNPLGELTGVTDSVDGAAVMYGWFPDRTFRRLRVTEGGQSGWQQISNGLFSSSPVALAVGRRHWVFGRGLDGRLWFTQETQERQQSTWDSWKPVAA